MATPVQDRTIFTEIFDLLTERKNILSGIDLARTIYKSQVFIDIVNEKSLSDIFESYESIHSQKEKLAEIDQEIKVRTQHVFSVLADHKIVDIITTTSGNLFLDHTTKSISLD